MTCLVLSPLPSEVCVFAGRGGGEGAAVLSQIDGVCMLGVWWKCCVDEEKPLAAGHAYCAWICVHPHAQLCLLP